ncbi:hypothetical protein SKAU_G00343570 [Synaphobranchus kaupii]|uniref:Uncharacterized protein n=1 Tax=Synaphobranchus kaupii TaxID=118154 RepID=A0A9Q1EJ05_SYNKA|nr:hypothetical protein SKAU_G00343570 [Synaphobranchus kaupii]
MSVKARVNLGSKRTLKVALSLCRLGQAAQPPSRDRRGGVDVGSGCKVIIKPQLSPALDKRGSEEAADAGEPANERRTLETGVLDRWGASRQEGIKLKARPPASLPPRPLWATGLRRYTAEEKRRAARTERTAGVEHAVRFHSGQPCR